MFQIDGDVLQRHVVEDDRIARPAAVVAGPDVSDGQPPRHRVVGAALVGEEPHRLAGTVVSDLDAARQQRDLRTTRLPSIRALSR